MVSRGRQSRKKARRFRGGGIGYTELANEHREGKESTTSGGGCGCGSRPLKKSRRSHQKSYKKGGYHFTKRSKKHRRSRKKRTHKKHRKHRGGSWPLMVKQALLPLTTFALQKGWQNKKRNSSK
jgi:hypothetical protein